MFSVGIITCKGNIKLSKVIFLRTGSGIFHKSSFQT